jgi:hypothetical protein
MHCKVTCILYKKRAHFSQLFSLQVRSVTPWQSHDRKSLCLRGRRHSSILYRNCNYFYSLICWLLSSRYVFSYHPFYFDFHSARVIFDMSPGFYFWNINRTPAWHLSKMFKVAFKDVSTKNSEPTYWTIKCLQCAEKKYMHQYVKPCLSKNPKYTFYTIKSSVTLA